MVIKQNTNYHEVNIPKPDKKLETCQSLRPVYLIHLTVYNNKTPRVGTVVPYMKLTFGTATAHETAGSASISAAR